MSEATVDVPAVGRVKKQQVYIAVAVVAGIVGYAYWRAAQAPAEDIPAYTEEDIISDGISDTAGGSAGGSANSGGASHDSSTTPDTDQEWAQQANEILSQFDSAELATALGRYLTGETVTAAQGDMVRAAIGVLGYPPGGKYEIKIATTPTPSALTEPKDVKVTAKTATTVTLSWPPVPSAAGYRVYRSDVSTNVGQSVDGKITIGGLTPGKTYKFHVRAQDAAGKTGPRSTDVSATTSSAKLSAPKSLTVTGSTKSTVSLKWSGVEGADGYRLYRRGVAQSVTASRDTAATVGGLAANKSYTFYVAATAGSTTGPKSAGKTAKTRK